MLAGNIELLKYILTKSVEVDAQSDAGTPLVWAAGHAQHDAVKVLLEHQANVCFLVIILDYENKLILISRELFVFFGDSCFE